MSSTLKLLMLSDKSHIYPSVVAQVIIPHQSVPVYLAATFLLAVPVVWSKRFPICVHYLRRTELT